MILRPDRGVLEFEVDGQPLTEIDEDDEGNEIEIPLVLDMYSETVRYNVTETIDVGEPGQHTLILRPSDEMNPDSSGDTIAIASVQVLEPLRKSNLIAILGILAGLEVLGIGFAILFGRMFKGLADTLDTRRSILLALVTYSVIAVWGFLLDSTIEYWLLAWMVAMVQGGSQALSRSLYARLSPTSKSGEFFGLFSIMSKFASIIGPLLFAGAVVLFGSSRPAILSLIVLFFVGGYLLTRVNIEEGISAARAEDERVYGTTDNPSAV